MDTPQVTPALLSSGLAALAHADAVLGLALDGGYSGHRPAQAGARAFAGVPKSAADTGRHPGPPAARARAPGGAAPALRDVDRADDVRAVARLAPGTGFAACAVGSGRDVRGQQSGARRRARP